MAQIQDMLRVIKREVKKAANTRDKKKIRVLGASLIKKVRAASKQVDTATAAFDKILLKNAKVGISPSLKRSKHHFMNLKEVK